MSLIEHSNGKVQGAGISQPSVEGQCRVIRAAYEKANLDPSQTSYIECHGTGTAVGDPIELQAISKAVVDKSNQSQPLLVGSVSRPLKAVYVGDTNTNTRKGQTVSSPSSRLAGLILPRNIGHSEASSSISTIIKVILAIENGIIPPTAGVENLNTKGMVTSRLLRNNH